MNNAVVIEKLVTMTWELSDQNSEVTSIPEEHIPALDEKGMELVSRQFLNDVSTAGTLTDNIHMLLSDPDDGIAYTGSWQITDINPGEQSYSLPFGVEINVVDGGTVIASRLYSQFAADPAESSDDDLAVGASGALESFLLALAAEGVNLNDHRIRKALEVAVEQIGNNL
jgi:hypothetical protein